MGRDRVVLSSKERDVGQEPETDPCKNYVRPRQVSYGEVLLSASV